LKSEKDGSRSTGQFSSSVSPSARYVSPLSRDTLSKYDTATLVGAGARALGRALELAAEASAQIQDRVTQH